MAKQDTESTTDASPTDQRATPGICPDTPVDGRLLPRREFVRRYPPGTHVVVYTPRDRVYGPFRVTDTFTIMGHLDESPEDIVMLQNSAGKVGRLGQHRGRLAGTPPGQTYRDELTLARHPATDTLASIDGTSPATAHGWKRVAVHPTYIAWAGAFHEPALPPASGMGQRDMVEVVRIADETWRVRVGKRDERDWNSVSWAYFPTEYPTRTAAIDAAEDWFADHPVTADAAARVQETVTAPQLTPQL